MDIFPTGSWFRLTRRRRKIIGIAFGSIVALCLVLYIGLRIILIIEAHRAASFLAELSKIQIGEDESTALKPLRRYVWQEMASATEPGDHPLLFDPWHLWSSWLHLHWPSETMANNVPLRINNWRRRLGLRLWLISASVRCRDGKVHSVSANVAIEGKDEWLMANWSYETAMDPRMLAIHKEGFAWRPEMDRYFAHWSHLHMEYDTGEAIQNLVTPDADPEELQAARTINLKCLTSMRGCRSLCDLMPDATRYRHEHNYPELGWNSGSWGRQDDSCR